MKRISRKLCHASFELIAEGLPICSKVESCMAQILRSSLFILIHSKSCQCNLNLSLRHIKFNSVSIIIYNHEIHSNNNIRNNNNNKYAYGVWCMDRDYEISPQSAPVFLIRFCEMNANGGTSEQCVRCYR